MIIFGSDGETFINCDNVRYYKIAQAPEGCVLRAYMTRGESVLIARGPKIYLVNVMEKIAEAINEGKAFYKIGDSIDNAFQKYSFEGKE